MDRGPRWGNNGNKVSTHLGPGNNESHNLVFLKMFSVQGKKRRIEEARKNEMAVGIPNKVLDTKKVKYDHFKEFTAEKVYSEHRVLHVPAEGLEKVGQMDPYHPRWDPVLEIEPRAIGYLQKYLKKGQVRHNSKHSKSALCDGVYYPDYPNVYKNKTYFEIKKAHRTCKMLAEDGQLKTFFEIRTSYRQLKAINDTNGFYILVGPFGMIIKIPVDTLVRAWNRDRNNMGDLQIGRR